ncbi:MAG: hypothetical protein H6683_08305 [Deltaproteobacteria bacterium]|nr:hypothetical protein [Deltaproteobacteria bacterium]
MLILVMTLVLLALPACGGDDDDDDNDASGVDDDASDDDDTSTDDDDDDVSDDDTHDGWTSVPIEASDGFKARQKKYLDYCGEANNDGDGGFYGQYCVLATGGTNFDMDALYSTIEVLTERDGSADFRLNALMPMLFHDREHGGLPDQYREDAIDAVLGFKFWYDEPGPDNLQWWSENHQILYYTAQMMAGQFFRDETFTNSGWTGQQQIDRSIPRILRWLNMRGRVGFSEFNSNTYLNEDMPALLNLVKFGETEEIRTKAASMLDLVTFTFAMHMYQGRMATAMGRTYPRYFIEDEIDSTQVGAYILTGLKTPGIAVTDMDDGNFTGVLLAHTDAYAPPAFLEEIAADAAEGVVHKQRDSLDLEDGPDFGIGYESYEDVMFWWGCTGYMAPQVIDGSLHLIDDYNMWEGNTWSDVDFLKPLVGTPIPKAVAQLVEPMTRGPVLEAASTYVFRTPDWQLAGAQDYKPGYWTGQVHPWRASIADNVEVFTTYPGGLPGDYMAGPWTGGFMPRGTFFENVGVMQYKRPKVPIADAFLFVDYTHAFFPKNDFDEVVRDGNWTFGRKGEVYIALYSQTEPEWADGNDYELIAEAKENIWIIEIGEKGDGAAGDWATYADFDDFMDMITSASVTVGDKVRYDSPSVGLVEVGDEGPMTVKDAPVDIGPYDRMDDKYAASEWGSGVATIAFDGRRLELDFNAATRTYLEKTR